MPTTNFVDKTTVVTADWLNDVDAHVFEQSTGFRNKIIGGDFTTNPWQRGTTFTAPASQTYTADRWRVTHLTDGVVDILKTADAPTAAQAGHYSAHCLHADVTTADASISAAQLYLIMQRIEGLNAVSFGFGQAGTRYVTLSFWVKSTKTGTFCCSLRNNAGDRSYVKEYTINVTDTWEKKIITFPVDTSGTWLYDSGVGLSVTWALACGTNFQTTAETWASGDFVATSNQVNALDSTSNNFKLALVQLEAGTVATPFEARDVGTELILCRRYLPAILPGQAGDCCSGWCTTTTQGVLLYCFPVRPRVAPAGITVSNASHFQVRDASISGVNLVTLSFQNATLEACLMVYTTASGLTAGYPTSLYAGTPSAYVLFTGCEL